MPTVWTWTVYGIQFPIPDELDVGLHDHLALDGFNVQYWREMGKRWRALCRRLLCHVSQKAGSKLQWMKELAAQQAREQTIEIDVEALSGKIFTLRFAQFDLDRRGLTVDRIKKRIEKFEAIPYDQQQLMLNDRVLDNGELLDHDKLDGSRLHLALFSLAK